MNIGLVVSGLAWAGGAAAGGVGGALLVHRFVPVDRRQANNDVAGLAFAIIGVLYAILLTFVTINVWDANDGAQEESRREALAVVDLRRYADSMSATDGGAELLTLASSYVDTVEHREWPRMAAGEPVTDEGARLVDRMWRAVDAVRPADETGLARQQEARATLRDLEVSRDARLAAIDAGLPKVMWLALVVGAGLTLVNAMMFGVQGSGEYVTIIAMLAAMSALLLFAVYQMEYPYQRAERVGPSVFVDVVGGLTAGGG